MQVRGFPRHLTRLFSQLCEGHQATVRTAGGYTDPFEIGRGVRQGCILSPYLFNIYVEDIKRSVTNEFEGGVKIGGERRNNTLFADDTTLVCSNK